MAFSRKRCDDPPTHQLGQKKSNTSDEQQLSEKLLPNRLGGDKELQPPPAAFYASASGSPFLGNQFSTYIPLGAAVDPDEIVALDADGMPITRDEYFEILNQELPATAQTLHERDEAQAEADPGQPLEEMLEVVDEAGNTIAIPIEPDAPCESSQIASWPLKRSPDREQTPQSQSDQRDTPGSHKSSVDRGHVPTHLQISDVVLMLAILEFVKVIVHIWSTSSASCISHVTLFQFCCSLKTALLLKITLQVQRISCNVILSC